jgi:arylsulfatase A-like enzyme
MMALALFIVLVLAKVAAMAGHGIPLSPWSIVAYAWQDALVALVFGLVHRLTLRRRHAGAGVTALYWALIVYAAINIPIGRVLATPLTWPMLRATRGALADSLLLHVTWTNTILMACTVAAAVALPRLFRRLPASLPRRAALCAVPLVAFAPFAGSRVDAQGRDLNVLVALVQSGIPHVRSRDGGRHWRTSRFETAPADDLSRLRGAVRGRNVVVVSLESTAAQYLPLYGGRDDVMPALGVLARNSIVFDYAYAAYPESIKGLFSMLCSTFPAFDVEPMALSRVPCAALPAALKDDGYATGLFHSGRFDYLGMEAVIASRGYDALEDAGDISGNHRSSFGVDEPSTVARILSWVDGRPRDRPFFLTYMPIAGHHPYETSSPGVFPNDDDFGRYRNALREGDMSLGALIAGLQTRGLGRDTVWIIFGDHGEAFGQHEGNYGHTFFLYDENVRVPFIIAAPGVTAGQTHVSRVVSLVDLAPTVLDLLGMTIPAGYQGQSMLDSTPAMALFFTDYSLPLVGLVDGRWKAVHDLDAGRTRLFDLAADSGETRDISGTFPDRADWYAETLRRWTAAQKHYLLNAQHTDDRPTKEE